MFKAQETGEFDSWHLLEDEFREACQTLSSLRFENEGEAEERAKREGRKKATTRDFGDFDRLAYAGDDQDDLQYYLDSAKALVRDLEALFAHKLLSLQFLKAWGAFQFSYGLVMAHYLSRHDAKDARRAQIQAAIANAKRGNEKTAKDANLRRQFVSILVQHFLDRGCNKKTAMHEAAQHLQALAERGGIGSRSDKWLKDLLDDPTAPKGTYKLKSTFTKNLRLDEIKSLAAAPDPTLPSETEIFHDP